MENKYTGLKKFLENQDKELIKLSYKDIEKIIGAKLPESARKYSESWWANCNQNVQARAWMEAGYLTDYVTETYNNEIVIFTKNEFILNNN